MQILHLSFCRIHSRLFCRSFNLIKSRLHRPLVHQHKSDIGLITGNGRYTGVHPDIVIDRQVIIPVGSYQAVFLPEHTVEKPVLQGPVVIIKLHKKIRRICTVDPLRGILNGIICRLSCNRIAEHDPANSHAAEQADIEFLYRTDPVRGSLLIHLKAQIVKNVGRITESQMTVDIPVEMVTGSVFHPLVELYKFGILGCHIDLYICRDSLAAVRQPLDNTGVFQRRHPHRAILIIYLGVEVVHLELRHHIHHASHFSVSQKSGRFPVKEGNLVKGKLFDIRGEFSRFHGHKLLVFFCVNNGG